MSLLGTRLRLGSLETRALTRAAESGHPTLLCLHGWGDSADAYRPLLAALDGSGFGAVAVDAPGHGEAEAAQAGPKLPQWTAMVTALIESAQGRSPLIVVGQSFGGRAALMALARSPHLQAGIERVIAIGPAPLRLPPWQQVFVRNRSLAQGVAALSATPESAIEAVVQRHKRTSFHAPEQVPPSVFEDYRRHVTSERAARSIDELRDIGAEIQAPLDLAGLWLNVELIWGRHDRLAPLSGADDYLRALPQARLRVLDCGHHAHIEAADTLAALIRQIDSH